MAHSREFSNAKPKTLARWFPTLAAVIDNAKTPAQLETLEILMDVEQVSHLLSSFDDVRQGRIVSMNNAFGDL